MKPPLDLREVARQQNDRDHAAGLLPSRHVEDEAVLHRVATILRRAKRGRVQVAAGPDHDRAA